MSGSHKLQIALATGAAVPKLEDEDLQLQDALQRRGASVDCVIWQTPWEQQANQFDLVVVRSCWDYVGQPDEFIAWTKRLQDSGVMLVNDINTIHWNFVKTYLKELEDAGIAIVPTLWVSTDSHDPNDATLVSLKHEIKAREWKSVVVKPAVSNDGKNTFHVRMDANNADQELAAAIGAVRAGLPGKPIMVQRFMQEVIDEGEWSLVFVDGKYMHAVLKTTASHDFRVQSRYGGESVLANADAAAIAVAAKIVARCPAHVFARIDLVRAGAQWLLAEAELIEPSLYMHDTPATVEAVADAVMRRWHARAV